MKGACGFGMCLIASGSEVGKPAEVFPYGTLVNIVDWDQEDSGLLTIATQGVQKFRIVSSAANAEGLLIAEVEMLPFEEKVPVPAEYRRLPELLKHALDQVGALLEYKDPDFEDAVWVSSRLIELLPMSVSERHDLVATVDPVERLSGLLGIIDSQL